MKHEFLKNALKPHYIWSWALVHTLHIIHALSCYLAHFTSFFDSGKGGSRKFLRGDNQKYNFFLFGPLRSEDFFYVKKSNVFKA